MACVRYKRGDKNFILKSLNSAARRLTQGWSRRTNAGPAPSNSPITVMCVRQKNIKKSWRVFYLLYDPVFLRRPTFFITYLSACITSTTKATSTTMKKIMNATTTLISSLYQVFFLICKFRSAETDAGMVALHCHRFSDVNFTN